MGNMWFVHVTAEGDNQVVNGVGQTDPTEAGHPELEPLPLCEHWFDQDKTS